MPVGLRALVTWLRRFVPAEVAVDAEAARRAPLTVALSFFLTAACMVSAGVAWGIYQEPVIATVDGIGAGVTFIAPFLLLRLRSLPVANAVVLGVTVVTIALAGASVEGLTSPALAWIAVVPLLASVLVGRSGAVLWTVVCVATLFTLFALDRFAHVMPNREMAVEARRLAALWNFAFMAAAVLGFCVLYETLLTRSGTTLAQTRRELDATREQTVLAERMASLGRLAAGVAHEINNPSTFVTGNVRLARDTVAAVRAGKAPLSDLEEIESALSDALIGATRITETVRDLKTLGRSSDDKVGPVDASEVMDVALRIVSSQLKHRVTVVRNLAHVPPVIANESRLGQVFVNLLTNAADAMPERAADLSTVKVTSRAMGSEVCIEVQDNGGGISAEARAHIFDPFFTTKPVGSGPGLGLSISRNLVEQMGGRIEVDSTLGSGSTFRVWLPVSLEKRAVVTPPAPVVAVPPMRRLKVLILDDDLIMCRSLERMLGRKHHVEHHQSAKEALQRTDLAQFDAILCDVMMPDVTGFDFYDAIEKQQPQLAARIGFLSGGSPGESTSKHAELFRTRLVTKPFDGVALESLLKTLAT